MKPTLRIGVLATVAAAAAMATLTGTSFHGTAVLHAADDPGKPAYFTEKVKPILETSCGKCHTGANHRGGYSMNTRELLLKGGHHGTGIVPGHPEQSTLIIAVQQTGSEDHPPKPMPPADRGPKLSDADIATLQAWIKAGAPTPADPLWLTPDATPAH